MRRLLVNDYLTTIPGTRTFWHDLQEWFAMTYVGGDYGSLAEAAAQAAAAEKTDLIIRNGSWFGPIEADVPTISLIQDIHIAGAVREMQDTVVAGSRAVVFNSEFTASKYEMCKTMAGTIKVIPLPIDFSVFEPGNPMGLQQALSLPDNCICWIGAQSEIKGYDIFLQIVRRNPDLHFVAVFKDQVPDYVPPNMRAFCLLTHEELVKVIGACRVGLCTSRMESQHLAGVEMGACGLPMVAPPVGTYFERENMPGLVVKDPTTESLASAVRACLSSESNPQHNRDFWQREFDKDIIRSQWAALIEEVECSGRS